MSADVIDLAGNKIEDETKPARNPNVADLLEAAAARNDNGETSSIIIISVAPDGGTRQSFYWGPQREAFAALLGSMEIMKHQLIDAALYDGEEDALIDGR